MELGSGTGKHAKLLAEAGYPVHGIERSPEMLARAAASAKEYPMGARTDRLDFTQEDIRTVRLGKHFDAVVALFHVMSYQTTNEDVRAAFETARRHLNKGGIFIFDVWYGPAVLTKRPETRIKRVKDEKTEITRLAEPVLHPNENLVAVNYHVFVRDLASKTVAELKETHAMRYFFKPEIELWSSVTGFTPKHAAEWFTEQPISTATWGACFCLQAL